MGSNFTQTGVERSVYKKSKLYIFKWNMVFVIKRDPLRAWAKSNLMPRWVNTIPPDHVFNLSMMEEKAKEAAIETNINDKHLSLLKNNGEAIKEFINQISPDIRDCISNYRNQHWRLLVFGLRCDGAEEMLLNNEQPAFPYLYACNKMFLEPSPSKPVRTARRLLRLNRRKSLGILGYPATKSTVKILSKIKDPHDISIEKLKNLKKLLWNPSTAKQICHFPTINSAIIEIMSNKDLKESITPNFLQEVAAAGRDERNDVPNYIRDSIEIVKILRLTKAPTFKSARHLSKVHHDLTGMLNSRQTGSNLDIYFPPPPVPEKENVITALRNTHMLKREGIRMSNCARSYERRIAVERSHYMYHVENHSAESAPEKATMSLVRDADGCWIIDQIKGPGNSNVSRDTRNLVKSWLDEYYSDLTFNALLFCRS